MLVPRGAAPSPPERQRGDPPGRRTAAGDGRAPLAGRRPRRPAPRVGRRAARARRERSPDEDARLRGEPGRQPGRRPDHRPHSDARSDRPHAAALLLSPIACVGIVLVSAYALYPIERVLAESWSERAQRPLWSAFTVGLALLLAVFAARWARHTALDGPLRIALGVVLPVGVAAVVFLCVLYPDDLASTLPGLLLWLAGLTLALWAAASLAVRHRLHAAWWVGVLGALAAADLAMILAVVDAISAGYRAGPVIGPTPVESIDRSPRRCGSSPPGQTGTSACPDPRFHGRSLESSATGCRRNPCSTWPARRTRSRTPSGRRGRRRPLRSCSRPPRREPLQSGTSSHVTPGSR